MLIGVAVAAAIAVAATVTLFVLSGGKGEKYTDKPGTNTCTGQPADPQGIRPCLREAIGKAADGADCHVSVNREVYTVSLDCTRGERDQQISFSYTEARSMQDVADIEGRIKANAEPHDWSGGGMTGRYYLQESRYIWFRVSDRAVYGSLSGPGLAGGPEAAFQATYKPGS